MKLTYKSEEKNLELEIKLRKSSPADRFRLSVSRSTKNISAQIIDDT